MFTQAYSPTLSPSQLNLFTLVRELPADLETPVSVYLKLAGTEPSFLLESVTGGEQLGRYSFIGVKPSRAYVLRGLRLEEHSPEGVVSSTLEGDILDTLRSLLQGYRMEPHPGLPRFSGGLVGYLGYDAAAQMEPVLPSSREVFGDSDSDLPEAIFLFSDTLVAFDHAYGKMLLIANIPYDGDEIAASHQAKARLDELENRLARPLPPDPAASRAAPAELLSNTRYAEFIQAVEAAREHIAAGDIFQVVLSQRFHRTTTAHPFAIYRALRRLNPSPYMFYFDFAGLTHEPLRLIGASPEMHVRLEGAQATLRPIAGTRPRGKSAVEDKALQAELLADPKERAEHVMLVDLARNDLGRICRYGSIEVPEMMGVERYSHVMHMVSQVEGRLGEGCDAFDLMRATFPAGTVSGAPKIRAMQIIAGLEKGPRGPYAGAVGYFSFDGSMDTCITIRTLVMQGSTISIQAGAGIVADSDPDKEYHETLNKARALAVAVENAEKPN